MKAQAHLLAAASGLWLGALEDDLVYFCFLGATVADRDTEARFDSDLPDLVP
jgi:hypothetical protein